MADGAAQAIVSVTRTIHDATPTISDVVQAITLQQGGRRSRDAFYILLPLIVVMSTFLLLMTIFLICVLAVRRRRGISLRDSDGPVDLSREDLIQGEGGFDGVESRWLELATEAERREYLRAKGEQLVLAQLDCLCNEAPFVRQTTSFSTRQTHSQPTSHSRNSCQFKRRVYRHGPSSRIMRQYHQSSSTLGRRLRSFRIPSPRPACSPTCRCQS